MWSPLQISFLSVMPLLAQPSQPHNHYMSLRKDATPPPTICHYAKMPHSTYPRGPAFFCLAYADICLHLQWGAVSGLVGSTHGQALTLIFQGHKWQLLLSYYIFSAFTWNFVHTKLTGLDPAPPKSIPGKIIQEKVEEVQYHEQSPFLLTEQVTPAQCSNDSSIFTQEDGRGEYHIHWALTINKALEKWASTLLSGLFKEWRLWHFGRGGFYLRSLPFLADMMFQETFWSDKVTIFSTTTCLLQL